MNCAPGAAEVGIPEAFHGRLFVAAGRGGNVQRRAIFVADWANATSITLRGATYDTASGQCSFGQIVLSIPMYLDTHIVFDAGLRYFAYTAEGQNVDTPSVTLQEIDWERVEDNSSRVVQAQTRTVVTSPQAVARVREAAGVNRVAVVPTWRDAAGRTLRVAGHPWRVISTTAQRLPVPADDPQFAPLERAGKNSECRLMNQGWSPQQGFEPDVFEDATHCFAVMRGNPQPEPGTPVSLREQVLVAVFERPEREALPRLADNPPAPIASLPLFTRAAAADKTWYVGREGRYAGWLALKGNDAEGKPRLVGLPWSTCALWRLGRELNAAAVAAAAAASAPAGAGAGAMPTRTDAVEAGACFVR